MNGSFEELGVSAALCARLAEKEIKKPALIQKRVIPRLAKKESMIFSSATGTGKTFAYLLPVLEDIAGQVKKPKNPLCVVVAPTVELCSQIKQEADFLLAGTGLKTALLPGQAQMGRQIDTLAKEKPVLVTGNPGRLLALAKMNKLKFDSLLYLVLDEGDRLISGELIEETAALVSSIVKKRPIENTADGLKFISCSATFHRSKHEKLLSFLGDNAKEKIKFLETKENILKEQIEHWAFYSEEREKIEKLRSFISAVGKSKNSGKSGKILVFTARGRQIENIVSKLGHYKINTAGLWGKMDKKLRKQSLDDFRSGKLRMLVTSDLASRGLDIPDVDYIVSLDTDGEKDTYIHRAGRTARAGKKGYMVTFGNENELRRLSVLEKKLAIIVYPKELFGGKIITPKAD